MYGNENRDAQPIYVVENPNHTANGPGAAGALGIIFYLFYKIIFWCVYFWYSPEYDALNKNENVYKILVTETIKRSINASPEDTHRYHIFNNYTDMRAWMEKTNYSISPVNNFTSTLYSSNMDKEYEYEISSRYVIYKNKKAWIRRQFMVAATFDNDTTVNVADKIIPRKIFLWLLNADKDDIDEYENIEGTELYSTFFNNAIEKQSSWGWFVYSQLNLYRWWNEWLD